MKKQLKSLSILLLTAMIWGFAFVAQLLGTEHVGTFTFNGVRFLIGGLSLIPVVLIFEKIFSDVLKIKKTVLLGMVAGTILFTASTLQQYGIEITQSAGKSGFITGLYTVIVPIAGILFHKKTKFNIWIGALLTVFGLYLLCMSGGTFTVGIGDLLLFIGAFVWAAHIMTIDSVVNKIHPIFFAMIQFLTAASLSLICMFIFEQPSVSSLLDAKYPILYAGVMSVGVAYTCQIIGQKNADPTYASIVLSTESVFSAIGEAVVFSFFIVNPNYVPLGFENYLGCAIMFFGIVVSQLDFSRRKAV